MLFVLDCWWCRVGFIWVKAERPKLVIRALTLIPMDFFQRLAFGWVEAEQARLPSNLSFCYFLAYLPCYAIFALDSRIHRCGAIDFFFINENKKK